MSLFRKDDSPAHLTPVRKDFPLHEAAHRGDLDRAKELLQNGSSDVNGRDRDGATPLHWAIGGDCLGMVQLFIEHGADVRAVEKRMGNTPLHLAAYHKLPKVVELLIASGADVNAVTSKTRNTPLHLAAMDLRTRVESLFGITKSVSLSGQMETVRLLLHHGADTRAKNANGKTAFNLAFAAKLGDVAEAIATWREEAQTTAAITTSTPGEPVPPRPTVPGSTTQGGTIQEPAILQADANGRGLATDDRASSPQSLTDPDDREIFFLQYFAEMQLVANTQAIHRALVGPQSPLATMHEVRLGVKAVDQEIWDLEHKHEQSKQLLHQMAAGVKEDPTFEPAVTARNEALTRYQVSLKSLEAVCGKKADLCKKRLNQKRLLRAAQDACRGMEVEGELRQLSSEADIDTVLGKVGQAMEECKKTLEPAVQATQEALKQLQLCLEKQHAAAQQVKPWLMEACSLAGPVIHKALQAMEQEDNGPAMVAAQVLHNRLHAESQELAGLVHQHESLKASELKMGLLLRDLRAVSDRAKRLRLEVELAAGKEGGAGSRQEELAATERRQHELEEKRQALLVSVTNTQFLKLFPEADLSPEKADQLSRVLPAHAGGTPGSRGDDIYDAKWSLKKFRDGLGTQLAPHVRLVEDHEGTQWVIKELGLTRELRREGNRLQVLQHPLVIRLERIFFDKEMAYLQMPYCKKGNLRPWFETIKRKAAQNVPLTVSERQQVYSTMRQVFQAVAFIHRKGVVHRDLKPENILLQDDGNIALCDFGVSHDVSGQYQTTVTTSGRGHTAAYAAPEVLLPLAMPSARQFPFAQDLWSLGVMLTELESGSLPTLNFVNNRLELPVPSLDTPSASNPSSPSQKDPWVASLRKLSASLLQVDPSKRPSVDDALSDPDGFLARDLAQAQQAHERHMHAVSSFLESLRRSPSRSQVHSITLTSWDNLDAFVACLLAEFSSDGLDLLRTLSFECDGVRLPLSEVMDRFFQAVVLPKYGIFEQGGADGASRQADQVQEGVAFLPKAVSGDGDARAHHLQQMRGVGRALAKAVLECLHVPVCFSTAMCCCLVGDGSLSDVTASECLDMLEEFDADEARRMRTTLATTHGNGQELMMTVSMLMGEGSQDHTPITDANKANVVRAAAQQRLVGVRQEELEALRKGFLSLCNLLEDELQLLTGQGMATLFFGQEYVDVDKAVAAFEFSEEWEPTQVAAAESDDEWWVEEPPRPASKEDASKWLRQFIREASETGLRLLGLRAFGSVHGLANGRCLVLPGDGSQELPVFDRNTCRVYLPVNCKDYAGFRRGMERALRAGEHGVRTDAQNAARMSREELDVIVTAMRREVRAGGWYRCPNGHPYAIGECGGAMQEATCPACGPGIGGQQHRVRGDNQVALDIDGAQQSAWPLGEHGGPAVSQTSGDASNTGGEADFVGLEGTHNVVNHEGTLSFKVRFHDSKGNEMRCFLPHSRVKLRITCAREGAPPEVLLERCALFGEDGSLTAVPDQVISKGAANACQGALVLDEEGDIAVRDLRFSLDFSGQDPAVGRSANHVQAVDIRVSLEVPPAGRLNIAGAGKAEAAPSELSEGRQAQGTEWSTITKAKTLQVLPSSRPSRVRLCYQDGKIWRESLVPSGRRVEGGTARTKEFQLQRVVVGQSLPQLAIRVETEAGQKLLGPDLEGEGHKADEPAREMPDFERVFAFKLVAAGGKYSSTPAFQSHGVLPRWELPCEAGRHVWEFKVRLTRRAAPPGVSQPLQGKEPREWPALELKQKIRVVVCVDAGPHAGWSLAQIPDLAPEGKGVASGAQPVDMGMGARSHRGPPRLTLGQPLSQSGLALVPVDEFGNAVVVEEAPTLRVVPQGAAENGQEPVTFLAEAPPVVLPGSKVDGGKAPVGAPGPVGHKVAPMDTLPGSYLRKVAGAHGQPSNYFCFCSASEAYLYRQEPLPSSTTASSSTGQSIGQSLSTTSSSSTGQYAGQSSSTTSSSATGQSTGVLSSTGFALELSSEDGATSRVDVDIANPGIGGGYFICVHGLPYEHLMSWQEHTGVWAEVRVLLPGGHSVRAFDERRDIRHMLLEAGSPGLQLQAWGQPGFPRVPARFNPQEVEQAWGGFGGAVAATPVVPAVHAPGALAASRLEDGTYQFPPFFTVHEAPNGPIAHGGVAASTVVRAEMAHAGVNPPQEATVQFTWRRNPRLVTRLDISVEGGGPSERHVVVAGSPLPQFQIELEGQDGVTRFATVNDAPNLRVDLAPVGGEGRSIRVRPPANFAPEENLHFSHRSLLKTAGIYRVSATWRDARIPDPSTVVTSFCFIDIIPGPPAKLATSNWRLRCCDNSGHKPIFDHLMVHCTDSHGNNTTEYRGGVQLSVVPIYIPAGGDVQAAEYAMLADGNPIFEMRRGELNIPPQYLRVGVGRVDGDYALRVETVPDTRQLEPLQLGFKFINLHGLSREVENVTQRMWDQQGTLLQRLAEHYVRTQKAHQRYDLAQQICEEAASDAHLLLPGSEPREPLPQMYQEACEKLGALAAGLNTARTDAYREVEVRVEDLHTRRPNDGLTERQRRAVNEARRDGHAYGTLPMIAVVEDADDARLLSWLTRDYTKAVLLTAGASAAVRQQLKVLGLNAIATGRVTAPDFDDLPRALSQAPGNPRPAASLLELKEELFQGDPETADHIMGIIQTLIGNVLILDRAEDAERLAEELWGTAGQGYDRPVLPPIISRDGGYLRDSNGMEWSAATLQAQLRRRPAHVFGPPTRENCRGLVKLDQIIASAPEILDNLDRCNVELAEADQQLQDVQPGNQYQNAVDEEAYRLQALESERIELLRQQQHAEARLGL
eukprot:jgi/Mesvir1/27347/Mv07162-RA.3